MSNIYITDLFDYGVNVVIFYFYDSSFAHWLLLNHLPYLYNAIYYFNFNIKIIKIELLIKINFFI